MITPYGHKHKCPTESKHTGVLKNASLCCRLTEVGNAPPWFTEAQELKGEVLQRDATQGQDPIRSKELNTLARSKI